MKTRSTAVSALGLFVSLALASAMWPQIAAAFHIKGVNVTVLSVDSISRTVNIDAKEFTGSPGGPHTAANIQWGDAAASGFAWTATHLASPTASLNTYEVSPVSHIYPDLLDRTITLTSDCCNTSLGYDVDTAVVQLGCQDTPKGGCDASAGKAQLQIKNSTDDNKDKLKFKWINGSGVTPFDTPGEYYLCVYDVGGLKIQAVAAGASWSTTGNGFKYNDPAAASFGLKKITLKNGTGTQKIIAKGQGTNLDDPNLLPLTQPVLAQLQSSAGNCWEHQFTSPEMSSDGTLFTDKEP